MWSLAPSRFGNRDARQIRVANRDGASDSFHCAANSEFRISRRRVNTRMLVVDAHLDLAYNALRGRDVLRPAVAQAADEDGIPSVGLPDLRQGKVGLVCATVFCEPSIEGKPGYRTADEARVAGLAQLGWYARQEQTGEFRFVRSAADVPKLDDLGTAISDHDGAVPTSSDPRPLPALILLEGADPLRTPADIR